MRRTTGLPGIEQASCRALGQTARPRHPRTGPKGPRREKTSPAWDEERLLDPPILPKRQRPRARLFRVDEGRGPGLGQQAFCRHRAWRIQCREQRQSSPHDISRKLGTPCQNIVRFSCCERDLTSGIRTSWLAPEDVGATDRHPVLPLSPCSSLFRRTSETTPLRYGPPRGSSCDIAGPPPSY